MIRCKRAILVNGKWTPTRKRVKSPVSTKSVATWSVKTIDQLFREIARA